MKIAVLMSTFNGEKYLDKQIESLSLQTIASSMTVYIRDDGSKDKTFEIIDKWKEKLSIILIKGSNVGPAKSFWEILQNKSIIADYYAFCDQDDIWDSDKLESAISNLNGNRHFWLCNCRIIDSVGNIVNKTWKMQKPEITISRLFVTGVGQGCAMVFTNDLRKFITSKNIQCIPMHDIIVMLYALNYGEVYWEHDPKFSYRVHDNNVVAKDNKSALQKVKTTLWNWENSSKNSMATVAEELLHNCSNLSKEDKDFLDRMSGYRSNIRNRLYLMNYQCFKDISKAPLRSYRIRLLLGLL